MKETVHDERMKSAVANRRFKLISRGGIVTHYGVEIAAYSIKGIYTFHKRLVIAAFGVRAC